MGMSTSYGPEGGAAAGSVAGGWSDHNGANNGALTDILATAASYQSSGPVVNPSGTVGAVPATDGTISIIRAFDITESTGVVDNLGAKLTVGASAGVAQEGSLQLAFVFDNVLGALVEDVTTTDDPQLKTFTLDASNILTTADSIIVSASGAANNRDIGLTLMNSGRLLGVYATNDDGLSDERVVRGYTITSAGIITKDAAFVAITSAAPGAPGTLPFIDGDGAGNAIVGYDYNTNGRFRTILDQTTSVSASPEQSVGTSASDQQPNVATNNGTGFVQTKSLSSRGKVKHTGAVVSATFLPNATYPGLGIKDIEQANILSMGDLDGDGLEWFAYVPVTAGGITNGTSMIQMVGVNPDQLQESKEITVFSSVADNWLNCAKISDNAILAMDATRNINDEIRVRVVKK